MDETTRQAIANILNNSKLKFQTESFIYTFTNENLKGYLPYFELEDKDILTVTGSGDHILNLLLSVDSIDTFDINLFAYYFFILKKYAIVALEVDEYLDFFSDHNPSFDSKMFDHVKLYWKEDQEALAFFEYLFHLNQAYYLKKTPMFVNNKTDSIPTNRERNIYLAEQNYYKLKRTILEKKVTFHHNNIKSLHLDKKFDYIFISNITDYLHNMFSDDVLRKYKKFVYSSLVPMLKKDGKVVSYLYDGKMNGFSGEQVSNILHYNFEQKPVGQDKIMIFTNRKAS